MNLKNRKIPLKELYWCVNEIIKNDVEISKLYELGHNKFGYYFYNCEGNSKIGFTFNPCVRNSDIAITIDEIHHFISRKDIVLKKNDVDDLLKYLKTNEKYRMVNKKLSDMLIHLSNYSIES